MESVKRGAQQYCQAVPSLMALDAATFNDGWAAPVVHFGPILGTAQ
jgi:hypothetical protein